MRESSSSSIYLRPNAGARDPEFAAAMRRAEGFDDSEPLQGPLDPVGRTRTGLVVRRNGQCFTPGPFLDSSSLPFVD